MQINSKTRKFIKDEAEKVPQHRRFAFYRWIISILKAGN